MFYYDNDKRCIEIRLGIIDSSSTLPVFDLRHTISFTYDGPTSTMPSSLSSVLTVFPGLVTTYYYKYDQKGLKIKDSVRVKNQAGDPADIVIHYVYTNDRAFITPVKTGFPMENSSLDTLYFSKARNIEKLVSRLIKSTGDQITTYNFAYDKSINPFNKLNIANSIYFQHSSIGLGYNVPLETHYMGANSNNMTSWSAGAGTAIYNYSYDLDKYPVRREFILPGTTSPFQVTSFEY